VRALVTGCAGFIGSHLTESLLADGVDVVGIDCFNDNYGRPIKLRNLDRARAWSSFDFVPVDLARGALQDLVQGADVVYHLAAEPGVRSSWGARFGVYLRNNVVATQRVLEAVLTAPDTRVVYASSSSVYGHAETYPTAEDARPQPYSPYGVTKLAAEHLCQLYADNLGVKAVSLRFFSVYGPRQRPDMAFTRFCHAALKGEPITVFGDGRQVRDFTFVTDVVWALRAAADRADLGGRVYNVGGGSQVSMRDVLDLLQELAGRRLEAQFSPAAWGDVRRTAADISRAREELGYEPRVSVPDGLQQQFEWASSTVTERVP
jgi:nucleoside-diphosphate-sugar epimerase